MTPKNTICLWYQNGAALEAARFYAATFADSQVGAIHRAPGDYPDGKEGDVLVVEFTVAGIPCIGLNGGPHLEPVHDLFMVPVAPQRRWLQGGGPPRANRSRAGGPARICNAADAAFAEQPFGQGSKQPHSSLRALTRPPAWPAARA